MSKHQKISINASEIPPSMEIFYIPNLPVTIPTKFLSDKSEKNYITEIQQYVATNSILIFTDALAQGKSGPTGLGVVIKNPGHLSSPIKFAKAITSCGTSY